MKLQVTAMLLTGLSGFLVVGVIPSEAAQRAKLTIEPITPAPKTVSKTGSKPPSAASQPVLRLAPAGAGLQSNPPPSILGNNNGNAGGRALSDGGSGLTNRGNLISQDGGSFRKN